MTRRGDRESGDVNPPGKISGDYQRIDTFLTTTVSVLGTAPKRIIPRFG